MKVKSKPRTRLVRVLFSVDVEVPINNPNTMKEGPGPVLFGFLEEAVENQLSEAPGCLDTPWRYGVDSFRLHSVEENKGSKATKKSCPCGQPDSHKAGVKCFNCVNCDGTGCPACDPCKPGCRKSHHEHFEISMNRIETKPWSTWSK